MKKEYDNLIDEYINNDDRKGLWELAFDHINEVNLNKIAEYYIQVMDSFHICELINISLGHLDLDYVFDKIISTNDKTFMFFILNNGTIKYIIDPKYLTRLEEACN